MTNWKLDRNVRIDCGEIMYKGRTKRKTKAVNVRINLQRTAVNDIL